MYHRGPGSGMNAHTPMAPTAQVASLREAQAEGRLRRLHPEADDGHHPAHGPQAIARRISYPCRHWPASVIS
jgi:hypothetical protein